MTFIVMCSVSGGVTGHRVAPMKQGGEVMKFDTAREAQIEANKARATVHSSNTVATFHYWVEDFAGQT